MGTTARTVVHQLTGIAADWLSPCKEEIRNREGQMKLIGVVQVKGGAGRSTVATNLAGELSKTAQTILVDCDMPQGSASSWAAVRKERGETVMVETVANHRELVTTLDRLKGQAQYAILDGPPRLAEMTRAILVLADLCLVPIGASPAEVWATSDLRALIDDAAKVRRVHARLVWTRFRPYTTLAQELSHDAEKSIDLHALKTTLGYRVAYAEALGLGRTVAELDDAVAKTEVLALVQEIKRLVR